MRRLIALVVVLLMSSCLAEGFIGSRDFGADDAERLMRLAQAELGNADAAMKADLMMKVLEMAWNPDDLKSIEKAIETGGFESVGSGAYYSALPDGECELAVKMVYMGWPDPGPKAALKITNVLEWLLPLMSIFFMIALLSLASVSLTELQGRMGKVVNNRR